MGVPKTNDGIPIVQLLSAENPGNLGMLAVGAMYNGAVSNTPSQVVRAVTSDATLKLQRLIASADDSGAKVELHWRANSGVTLSNATLIACLYVHGNAQQIELDDVYTSGQIVLKVSRTGGNVDAFARWKGYEI